MPIETDELDDNILSILKLEHGTKLRKAAFALKIIEATLDMNAHP